MLAFVHRLARRRNVIPGSMAHEVVQAIEEGAMKPSQIPSVFIDYLAPSIDTTASAIAAALWLFATNPDQWQLLRHDRARIPNAVNEVVRMESAVRAFGRRAERDTEIAGTQFRQAHGCWSCSRRRTAMTVSEATLTASTSRATLPVSSASGMEFTRARVKVWHGWR